MISPHFPLITLITPLIELITIFLIFFFQFAALSEDFSVVFLDMESNKEYLKLKQNANFCKRDKELLVELVKKYQHKSKNKKPML